MIRRIVAFLICWTIFLSLFAESYVVGAGTGTTNVLPVYAAFEYSWGRSIYTVAELNAAGMTSAMDLVSFSYKVANNPVNFSLNNQTIYVRLTSATAVEQGYPGTAGFTTVYSGNTIWNGGGWKTFTFTAPFTWNGTQNIEILWENRDGTYAAGAPSFHYTSTTPNMMSAYTSSGISFPSGIGNLSFQRPNITFNTAGETLPNPVANPFPADTSTIVDILPTLSWNDGGGNPTGYRLYFGTSTPPPLIGDLGNVTAWTPTNTLDFEQLYYWQIIPYNAVGEAVDCPILSFTTMPEGLLQVGTATDSQRQPFGVDYGYERSATLYTSAQLGRTAGSLNKIGWYNSYGTDVAIPYKIFAKETTATRFYAEPWDGFSEDAVLLMEGTHTFNMPGWNVFDLSNPFSYTGGNLIIVVETDFGLYGDDSFPQFRYTDGNSNTHQYWYSHYYLPTDNGHLNNNQANILLHLDEVVTGPPQPPFLTFPEDGATNLPVAGFKLRWSPNGNGGMPNSYTLFLSQTEANIQTGNNFPNLTLSTFNPTLVPGFSFNYGETWYWTVESVNSDGSALTMPPRFFQIEPDPRKPLPLVERFEAVTWPEEWIQYNTGVNSNRWLVSATNNAGNAPNELKASPISQVGTSRLVSPPLNTSGASAIHVGFNHFFDDRGPGVTAQLEYSFDGQNWYVSSWSHASGSGNAQGAVGVTITGLNSPITYLSWTLDGQHDQFDNWFVDDVQVEEVLTAPLAQLASSGYLSWPPVEGATSYRILASDNPYMGFVQIDTTINTTWQEPNPLEARKFYKVVAVKN